MSSTIQEDLDEDVYHCDFTTASEWEIFIARLEEIIHEWKLSSNSANLLKPLKPGQLSSRNWVSKCENIMFADFQFSISRYSLTNEDDGETPESDNLRDNDDENVKLQALEDMMHIDNDFIPVVYNDNISHPHVLARLYSLREFIVINPSSSTVAKYIAEESKIKILLSSICIAMNNCSCEVPVFIQALEPWRNFHLGLCEGRGIRAEFEMVHLKKVPQDCKHLTGLLNVFKSRIGMMSSSDGDPVRVSAKFTYSLTDWTSYAWSQEPPNFELLQGEIGVEELGTLPFGASMEPVSELMLHAEWPEFLETALVDSQAYSDLEPLRATNWFLSARMVDEPACLLSEYMFEILELCRSQHSMHEFLGDFMQQDSGPTLTTPFDVLTESKMPSIGKVIGQSFGHSRRDRSSRGPIANDMLMPILYFLFPDADNSQDSVRSPYPETIGNAMNREPNMAENTIGSGFKSAPIDGLVWRLAVVMAHTVHTLGGTKAAAHLWYEFCQELRFRWNNGIKIPGQRQSNDYRRHMEFIDYCNSKAAVVNILMKQQLSRIPNCHFINNDAVFLGPHGVVRRHLLSRDGLHLPPMGIRCLLGSILQHVVSVIRSFHAPPSPNSLPSPPLSWMVFDSLPATQPLASQSQDCENPKSRASSCGSSIDTVILQGPSYRDALLVPPAIRKLKPITSTVHPIQGKKLMKSKFKITKPPKLLPSSKSNPSKPKPHRVPKISRNKRAVFHSSVKLIQSNSAKANCTLSTDYSCSCLLDSFPTANRYSPLANSTPCEESAACQPDAKSLLSNSSISFCTAGNSIFPSKRRRRRPRKFQQHKSNLIGRGNERRKNAERKQTTSHDVEVGRRDHCDDYGMNDSTQCNSFPVERVELVEVNCIDSVDRAQEYQCNGLRPTISIGRDHGGIHEARIVTAPKICFQEEGLMVPNDRAGGDGITHSHSNQGQQSICVVASGNISQDNRNLFSKFSNNNQCVCISTMNIVYISSVSRNNFTQESIDNVIISGDLYYRQSKQKLGPSHTHAHLMVDEIEDTLEFNNRKFKIEHELVECGLYSEHVNGLTNKLQQIFLQDRQSGYIFLGQSTAVSMWCDIDHFYMFNSHSVDGLNKWSEQGKGHVFKCDSLMDLAKLLLTNATFSEDLPETLAVYNIFRISCSIISEEIEVPSVPEVMEVDLMMEQSFEDEPIHLNKKIKLDIPNYLQSDKKLFALPSVRLVDIYRASNNNLLDAGESNDQSPNNSNLSIDKKNKSNKTNPPGKGGRPPKPKRGRPETLDLMNDEQQRKAVETYSQIKLDIPNYLQADRKLFAVPSVRLVDIYRTSNNNLLDAGKSNDQSNLSIDKKNKSNKTNPPGKGGRPPKPKRGRPKTSDLTNDEQHRKAVETYSQNNPDVNRKSVKTYSQNNPDVNKKAVKTYSQNNPDIIRNSKKIYSQNNPDSTRKTSQTYRDNHPECNKEYKKNNPTSHLPKELRNDGLVAEYSGEKLKLIKPYFLKNKSLLSDTCSRCPHCKARLFKEELGTNKNSLPQWCCTNGKALVTLPPLTNELYKDKNFLKRPVKYNDFFAFASKTINLHGMKSGPQFLKIKGKVYHNVQPYDKSNINTSNILFDNVDDDDLHAADVLDKTLIRRIYAHLQSCENPFLAEYKKLHHETATEAKIVFKTTSRSTHGPVLGDRPTTGEVTAYINTDKDAEYNAMQVTVWKQGDRRPYQLYTNSPFLEPMTYPLLYPEGTPGWSKQLKTTDGKKFSLLRYTRNLLLSDDRFGKFGKLSETWLVDMYVRIEDQRLYYIMSNQFSGHGGGLRAAPADELSASIRDRGNVSIEVDEGQNVRQNISEDETIQGEGGVLPGRVYLPQSFTGSPRYMRKSYMDAMGIVSHMGGPTYFLTFTALGGWDEIKQSKYDRSRDQPDVVDRVFHLKLRELLKDIRVIFGKSLYIIYTIEFQMRGLPHCHVCFKVMEEPKQGIDIDKVIRADIPKPDEADGELRNLVMKHMIHGPCGAGHRTDLPCWDEKKQECSKHFPKSNVENTFIDARGFVNYKRSMSNKGEIMYRGKPVTIDDRWVVPYNAVLLLKYRCHINLELASTRSVVKYLFKYITKGPSLRSVAVQAVPEQIEKESLVNEVEEYVTQRYVGSSDAAWRVLSYDLTHREPAVISLPVHLEGKKFVIFKTGGEENALNSSYSLLEIYFTRPNLPEMRNMTYQEFYKQYESHSSRPRRVNSPVWDHPNGKNFLTKRQHPRVPRLYWVSPNFTELYYLRVLLIRFPCFGYSNLLELGGLDCNTFQEAAKAVGLAEDGSEYMSALEEGHQFMTGREYRRLFVILLREGGRGPEMWEKFGDQLAEDFKEMNPEKSREWCLQKALIDIDHGLRRHGSSLVECGLPSVEDSETELAREKIAYEIEDEERFVKEWESKLSNDQATVFNYLQELMKDDLSMLDRVIFLDGPGGSGKTLLLKVITAYFRANQKIVLCVATSGIAALNLPGGTTAHSMFKIPIVVTANEYWSITNGSQRADLIRHASLIIFDEAPMTHRHLVEMIDRSLSDLMNNNCLFGGKIVIFSGDFRQIPPVIKDVYGSTYTINASICKSKLWSSVKKMRLSTSHRVTGHSVYSDFLLNLGMGKIEPRLLNIGGEIEVFDSLLPLPLLKYVNNLEELIEFVFPDEILSNPELCAQRAILSTLITNVDEINSKVCEHLDGEFFNLYSRDRVVDDQGYHIDSSILHLAQEKGVPNHVLKLKVGAVCLITRNLNFDLGLVNGSKVIIDRILKNSIVCYKPGSQKRYVIPRISFKFSLGVKDGLDMIRMQFPLQLAYAMTIHKSQGQTIELIGLDLRTGCFTHGQLYVALSRTRSPENIRILVPETQIVDDVPHAKNIIYNGLLNN